MRIYFPVLISLLALTGCPTKDQSEAERVVMQTPTASGPTGESKSTGTPSASLQLVTTTFHVEGMDCADCGKAIETKLIGMAGVSTVSADEKAGRTIVQYDEGKVTKQQLIAAIDSLKFKAKEATP
jgi:copper chaperone CopZ